MLTETGEFARVAHVGWANGTFDLAERAPEAALAGRHGHTGQQGRHGQPAADLDGAGLWLIPGLVDAHLHAAWQAFDSEDREALGEARTIELINQGLGRTLAAGFTSVRDAGGLTPETLAKVDKTSGHRPRPKAQFSIELIDRTRADQAGGVEYAAAAAIERGAQWIKLVATAGVASRPGNATEIEAHFTAAEQRKAVRVAEAAGAAVMVHAWGGSAISDAIEAGAASIEHGIFLTPDQARAAAHAGVTFVPTLVIYRLVRGMIAQGSLPQAFDARVAEAVAAHPDAVRLARDAGVKLALGSDFGTPSQHGTAATEFDALAAAGLSPAEVLIAATRGGAELMARVGSGSGTSDALAEGDAAGRIAQGATADAVLLNRSPLEPGALQDPSAVVGIVLDGRYVSKSVLERTHS